MGMHNAAASGNVGLVKYALENGQPANSVLNGVLPLHAGCTGGSEPVVRLLLAHGADVNAQRLKSKTTGTAPGTEGSTPLHFAAANGHAGIVKLLLEHGARPGAADKDGFLPEALAAGNGHQDSVELLRDWMASYGPNGLAPVPPPGRSSSSGTVTPSSSHQADLSASSKLSSPTVGTSSGAGSGSGSGSASRAATQSPLRSQRSFEHLTSAAAGVKASLIGRRSQLAKVNSNPNLKSIHSPSGLRNGGTAIPPVPPTPLQLPSASSTSSTLSPSQYSAGQNSLMQVPMRSPSPNSQDDGQELGFYSSMTPAPTGSPLPLPIHLASLKDSKRRPSLPSILEKAAHPAASIRAALQSNAHAGQYGPGNTDMIEELSNEGHYGMPPSPSRIAQRITGKRSLSNMLRKATGGSTSSDGANAAGSLSPSRQHLPLTRTPEDERPPQSTDSLHPTPRPSVDEDPSWPNTAPHSQTLFSIPSTVADRQGAFAARPGDEHRLRGSASSSALSSQIGPFPTSPFNSVGRSRSSSNEQTRAAVTSNFARPALSGSPPSQGLLVGTAPPSPGHAAVIPSPLAESSANAKAGASSIGHDYRPRKSSNLSTPSPGLGRRATDEQHAQQSDSSSDPSTGESSGFAVNGQRRRCQSSASASSRRIATQSEHLPPSPARAQFANNAHARQDSDDAQEFLGDMPLPNPEEAAGEHHDVHHLPPGLRSLTPGRNATSSSWQAPSSNSGSGSPKVSSGHQPLPYHRTSSSNSSGSTSSLHQAYANASTGEGPISRSPHLSPRAQCVPLAEDNGASGVFERTKRSGSHTESMASKLSNSSLRSGHVTAHEQAQAILRHAEQFGPDGSVVAEDGTQTSLSAQLAAYGEALAFERRQAAEAASGVTGNAARSPVKSSPSGREGSSQVGLLPSVSEDHHNNTPVGRPYGYSVSTDASDASSSSALKSSSTYGGSTATLATSIASGMPPPPPGSARLRARSNEEVEKGRMQTMVVPARAVERSKSIVEPPSAATRSMGRTASDGEAVSDSSGELAFRHFEDSVKRGIVS